MDRRSFLTALIAMPALFAVLDACGSEADPVTTAGGSDATAGAARSRASRTTASTTDATAGAAAINAFAVDLYNSVAGGDGASANLVFSPASIAIALAMTS